MLLPTCLVGSYPQPEWLIDREKLSKQVPRVRVDDLWLVASDKLEAAQDDATILAIRDQERAGLDIITDGDRTRRHRHRKSRHRDQPHRPGDSGAAHHRPDPAQACG
jgi:methionine synthase II (cobalamin-independent)